MRFKKPFPNGLVLVDLGGLTKFSKEEQLNVCGICSGDVQCVLSFSSGGEWFASTSMYWPFKRFIIIHTLPVNTVQFKPFDEDEARVLMRGGGYSLQFPDFYRCLTNFNPSLLSASNGCKNEREAEDSVLKLVSNCITQFECSMKEKNYKWI